AEPFIAAHHRFYVFTPSWARLIRLQDGERRRLEWCATSTDLEL
ncbi:MAG: hypothetical protein ACI9MC_003606, partial [Kiritimatiellia bacterium]